MSLIALPDVVAPPTRRVDEAGVVLAGRYRLLTRLAASRSSQVWRARDERLGRTVAAKRVGDPVDAALEAQAASSVSQRGVVGVYDVVADEAGASWLVMEDLTGASLATVLQREGRLCAQEVAYVGQHALDALAAVHAANLVHRDVKPSNIQLTADGRVVLMDFGLTVAPCTTGGAAVAPIAGSLPYLAPEIVEHGRYSDASDLFALGMTLFTAVSGAAPMRLGSELGLPELKRLSAHVADRLVEHPQLLTVVFGLLDARVGHRMRSAAAHSLLTSLSPFFG